MQDKQLTLDNEPVYSDFADDTDFTELIEFYVSSVNKKKEELQTLFRSGDLDELKSKAHQMKGSAGGYGFHGLSTLAAELEQACLSKEIVTVTETMTAVLNYLDRLTI